MVKAHRQQAEMMFGPVRAKSGKDRKDFDALGVLFADPKFVKRREPHLEELYAAYESGGAVQLSNLERYLDVTWKINVTLLDSDHEATRGENLVDISRYHESGSAVKLGVSMTANLLLTWLDLIRSR